MKNDSLVIMAGGASSRMKKSLKSSSLPDMVREVAMNLHKSLIPLDEEGRPLLFFLFQNAVDAGIRFIYLITSPENEAFHHFVEELKNHPRFNHLEVRFAIQKIHPGKQKPLGTADALQQCLEQHPNLLHERFTVCNGDNLYSVDSLETLQRVRSNFDVLIAYDGEALGYSEERIKKFALLDFDKKNQLTQILEKPTKPELERYLQRHQKAWVSMNIFNFYGETIFPFLQKCPIHPVRQEKELPQAVQNKVNDFPSSVVCIPKSEKIPDLTRAEDISTFFQK